MKIDPCIISNGIVAH